MWCLTPSFSHHRATHGNTVRVSLELLCPVDHFWDSYTNRFSCGCLHCAHKKLSHYSLFRGTHCGTLCRSSNHSLGPHCETSTLAVGIMWITFRTFDVTKAVGEATFHVMTCNCVDIQSGYTHVSSPIRMGVGTCNHTVYGQLTCLHLFRLKCQVPARGGRVLSWAIGSILAHKVAIVEGFITSIGSFITSVGGFITSMANLTNPLWDVRDKSMLKHVS